MNGMRSKNETPPEVDGGGLSATIEDGILRIALPHIASGHHQLSVVWGLHELWLDHGAIDWVVDIAALDALPLPLLQVLLVLERDLNERG